ncbi:MAG: hypothetical protein CFE33_04120 [Pseudorhodobacter sp. PARRP1]|nr:MAG: hypothetical protein CFE33_04120 [Pseudorhodobacter sp. PARRP1]
MIFLGTRSCWLRFGLFGLMFWAGCAAQVMFGGAHTLDSSGCLMRLEAPDQVRGGLGIRVG